VLSGQLKKSSVNKFSCVECPTEVGSARRSLPNDTPDVMWIAGVLHPLAIATPMRAITARPSLSPSSFAHCAPSSYPSPIPAGLHREATVGLPCSATTYRIK